MSSHTYIPREQLDQENQHQNILIHDKTNNSLAPSKRPLSKNTLLSDKRIRLPLSGKNQNAKVPLQRSKSFIPHSSKVSHPSLSGTAHGVSPILSQKPVLAKSNSTMGFFSHATSSVSKNVPIVTKDTNPLKNEIFSSLDAHRAKDLVPLFTTDNIKKHVAERLPPLLLTLRETLSDRTSLLHASNFPPPALAIQNRDPIKKTMGSLDAIIDELAEDEESVEIKPISDLTPLEEEIPGYSPLSKTDIQFLKTGRRQLVNTPEKECNISFSISSEDEDEDEKNQILRDELEKNGPIGLSRQELEDLLEF